MAIESPRQPGSVGHGSDVDADARIARLLHDARSAAVLSHRLAMLDIESQHRLAWHRSHFNPISPAWPLVIPMAGNGRARVVELGFGLQPATRAL
jgi:hypothetical protein